MTAAPAVIVPFRLPPDALQRELARIPPEPPGRARGARDPLNRAAVSAEWGDAGATPEVSVLSIRHHRVPAWRCALVGSLAAQRDLRAWELVEARNFDNALTLGEAWQLAFERARGDHVFFLGDDDYLDPDALGVLAGIADASGADVVQCGGVLEDAHGRPYRYQEVVGLGLVRAAALRRLGGVSRRDAPHELDEVLLRVLAAGGAVVRVTPPYYHARLHRAQVSRGLPDRRVAHAAMEVMGYVLDPRHPPRADRLRPPVRAPARDRVPVEGELGLDEETARAMRHLGPERPPAALSAGARAARVERTPHGLPGGEDPEVSVLTIRFYGVPEWLNRMRASVAAQRGLVAWEHLEVQSEDDAFSLGEARNLAAEHARAPWLYVLDEDDWLDPWALAHHLDVAEAVGADRVACGGATADADGRLNGYHPVNGIGLLRKSAFFEVGGFPRRDLLEDTELNHAFLRGGYRVEAVQAPLRVYRFHRGQASAPLKIDCGAYEDTETFGFNVADVAGAQARRLARRGTVPSFGGGPGHGAAGVETGVGL